MKLRVKGSSIRFRLTQSEVKYFGETGEIEDSVMFPQSRLIYKLENSRNINDVTCSFIDNAITVTIPASISEKWYQSNEVAIDAEIETAHNKKLYILIEKDFKCLDNTVEDQSDNYPNPLAKNG
jgi:hypothetical protein